jgi:TATA-box binding protein (TBP) (component of TFIID and TFIIIB)
VQPYKESQHTKKVSIAKRAKQCLAITMTPIASVVDPADLDTRFHKVMMDAENRFSPPKTSTSTIVCTSNINRIDLEALRGMPGLTFREKRRCNEAKKQYRPFSNSVTAVFDKNSTVKVFVNGKFHVTGVKRCSTAFQYVQAIIEKMQIKDARITGIKVLTWNVSFHALPKNTVNLEEAKSQFTKLHGSDLYVRYNPDIYQGLIVKPLCPETDRCISILCFYTGTFIICGVQSPKELEFGFEFLHSTLAKIKHKIVV